ncbi:MAG: DNA gyrase inhibitor YacG [Geminicoccaceae bacterium]
MSGASPPDRPVPERRGRRCPLCGAPMEPRFRPFCSARCRDIDLGHWLSGAYAVPAVEGDDDSDEGGGLGGRDG